jgi:hypothetical protein
MVQVIDNPILSANQRMAEIGNQRAKEALAQANWLTENQQQQAQQAFQNQDVVAQRQLRDKAQTAADLGDASALKFLQAMNQPEDKGGGGTFVKNAQGQMVPAQLRSGEVPITQGQPEDKGPMGGIGLTPASPQMGGQQALTLDRLAQSVLKQNPALAQNPQAFFATLDKLKTVLPVQDQSNLEKMKFQFEQQKYANQPEREKAIAAAKEAGKNAGDAKQIATGAKDVLNSYNMLKEYAKKAPSGALESGMARGANFLNVPTEGSVNQAKYDATLNNLFLGTVRTLKGTGRIMQAEIQNIQGAAPKPEDSLAVKQAKTEAHMAYYRKRMEDLGYDPDTGELKDGAKAQDSGQPAAQGQPVSYQDYFK